MSGADIKGPTNLPIAMTMGDPAGIGLEVALKAWQSRAKDHIPPFYLIASEACIRDASTVNGLDIPTKIIQGPESANETFPDALPLLPITESTTVELVTGSISTAVDHALVGKARAVVTLPINKQNLYQAGFSHPGHTEFLGDLCEVTDPPMMMLAIPGLRTVLSTIHIPLEKVASQMAQLGPQGICSIAERVIASLINDFGINQPRLVIAGLNPHAGEQGTIGMEEFEIIGPAIDQLLHQGFDVAGPLPADTLFHEDARKKYDAVICHYHDQALIPLKTLNFHEGVNITLGLPIIRTSPDHGTAQDIAGQNKADPRSLISAIKMAAQIADTRQLNG